MALFITLKFVDTLTPSVLPFWLLRNTLIRVDTAGQRIQVPLECNIKLEE